MVQHIEGTIFNEKLSRSYPETSHRHTVICLLYTIWYSKQHCVTKYSIPYRKKPVDLTEITRATQQTRLG